ncbi:hypothetical protein CC2G_000905 [Coprinopsis cinerea AmutBmut pab1-1]|nr:hypothetical protein CC2G_000905 [Coprinopsis cinerea AmutBmut pab1-1]
MSLERFFCSLANRDVSEKLPHPNFVSSPSSPLLFVRLPLFCSRAAWLFLSFFFANFLGLAHVLFHF